MSQDKGSGGGPECTTSEEDAAFLRLVEDSYEAAGRPRDQAAAERVWNKLESRLGSTVQAEAANSPEDAATVQALEAARKRRVLIYLTSGLTAAVALVLFVNVRSNRPELSESMQARGGKDAAAADLFIQDQGAPSPGAPHRVQVKVQARADGFLALYRQQGEAAPLLISSFPGQKDKGALNVLEESAPGGTRYCIVAAKDHEGLQALLAIVPELWPKLPASSCTRVP